MGRWLTWTAIPAHRAGGSCLGSSPSFWSCCLSCCTSLAAALVTTGPRVTARSPMMATDRPGVAIDGSVPPSPQARPRRARYCVGWVARRGRCIPSSRCRRTDQPAGSDRGCRLPRDGVDHLVRDLPVQPRLAPNRACLIIVDPVGLVPSFLRSGEPPAMHPFHLPLSCLHWAIY